MTSRLIKTIELKNNLTLNLYDESIKMIGERWLVTLVARITIPVDETSIQKDHLSLMDKDEIKNVLGESVVFEQKNNRIFVNQSDKKNVFQEMCDAFLENTLPYLSHRNFSRRFLLKRIKEEMDKQFRKRP
ncbi:MAG: hypothetical protein ABIK98_09295 [Pseudomonadota bacterium]|uniref:Uncharacterized protein n=1 Tax=Candidatus Desulfatibia profunda TaxID=2841695 RepID=A0A8J6TM46_9BACT|nr:hypothetical protein [Candidatus Desulfatibia profunda]MBL7180901.1 hypothetical protein [Desulfobacterales bacterium]